MSIVGSWNAGAGVALFSVIAVGLALPGLRYALDSVGLGGGSLIQQLLVYEVVLAGVGLCVALIVTRLLPGTSPGAFSAGALDVGVSPVRFLGLGGDGITWRREIVSLTLAISVVTTIFVYLANRNGFSWHQALGLAPWILLFAALNAAGEEWIYRVALLRGAGGVLSLDAASLLSAAVFGVAHFGGMPGGPFGALAAALLGFILSRATLETGGVATAWVVHFIQDVVIFAGWLGAANLTAVAK
jgi:membrane protease YdiL (CAAX protease family)